MIDITHILIPYLGTPAEQELLKATCKIARLFKAKVSVVHVIEVPMALPVDADNLPGVEEANAVLDGAEDIAAESRASATTDLLQARDAGHAIVEEAISRGVDLIMMEAQQRMRLGMLSLGRTVDYVIKHAPCPVWISRQKPLR